MTKKELKGVDTFNAATGLNLPDIGDEKRNIVSDEKVSVAMEAFFKLPQGNLEDHIRAALIAAEGCP